MRLVLALACALLFVPPGFLQAQPTQTTKDVWQLVPTDGVAIMTLQLKTIRQDESMRMLPWEVIEQAGKSQLGVNPLTLERVDVIACAPGVALRVGAVVTLQTELPAEFFERFPMQDVKANKGVELYSVPGGPDICFAKKTPRQLLVGTKPFVLSAMKTQPGDGPLRQMAAGLGEPGPISLVIAMEPVREVIASFVQSPPLPAPIVKDVETVVGKADMIAMRYNLGSTTSLATLIQTKSPSDAPEVSAALSRLVKIGMQNLVATVQQQAAAEEGRLPKAAVSYVQRLAPEIEKNSTFKVTGNRLLLSLDGTQLAAGQVGIGVGLLLPAVQAARAAARRMQSQNNLRQIGLALHNFESTFKRLPADKDFLLNSKSGGKMEPNLSWRVHILPYIEQNALYQEFHLDEAWDSPHNIKLLERMPDVFRHPYANTKPGYTVYQQPTGQI